ncbi:hypothetical protein WKQ99_17850 [Pseudomonas atacamensis]|uniref:hypothetical protein n=1 Tax=Pseudomonas atacamensis TaxID=2565368 RepID=UPI0030D496C3
MKINDQSELHSNKLGDSAFTICESPTSKIISVNFDYACDRKKVIWAQQTFLQMRFVAHYERGKPLQVTDLSQASIFGASLRNICEYWDAHLPITPLWNWTEKDLTDFFHNKMVKVNTTEHHPSPVYANQQFSIYSTIFRISHAARLDGLISDGLSFPITTGLKTIIMEPLLDDLGLTIEEWLKGQSHPPVPLGIAAAILSAAIKILESEETAIALSLYSAWRNKSQSHQHWFRTKKCSFDIIQLTKMVDTDDFGIKEALQNHGVGHVKKLPWRNKKEFRHFRRRLVGACLNIMLIQSGHRSHEIQSTVSNDRRLRRGRLMVKQKMDKSLKGLKVYRPLAELSTRAADTLWSLSFVNQDTYPLPLQHSLHDSRFADMAIAKKITDDAFTPFSNPALNARLNSFYKSDVLPIMPEAQNIHPTLSSHQFRHSFAEFALRRFDEDVHESLREHFVQTSDYATHIYEHWKLNPAVQSMLEKNYIYQLIGKTAQGTLDSRFWGPAFLRIKAEISRIKILHPNTPENHYQEILDRIDRFAVFEWGFCVLFSSSKRDAKCCDFITGLPDVDALASPGRCSGCPNNMGNTIQKKNLVRIELAYSVIGDTHPIKAIGTLCKDMARQISHRSNK